MRRRFGLRWRMLLGVLLVACIAGLFAIPRARRVAPAVRPIVPPVAVQRSFQRFSDSLGPRLLDTLFALGYHGGYTWDEQSGAKRANLIGRTERQTAADSVDQLYEATLTLDFHHDSIGDVPPTVVLRFASVRDASKWILLTTDGFPEDASPELPQEAIRKMPADLHAALMAPFADRAEAYDWWKAQESKRAAVLPASP